MCKYLDVHMHEGMRVYYIMYACMHACMCVCMSAFALSNLHGVAYSCNASEFGF